MAMPNRGRARNARLDSAPPAEDAEFIERRRERVYAARRRWWVRTSTKVAMWLVGAYTVRLLHKDNFKIYLIVSILAYIYISVMREGDSRARQAVYDGTAAEEAEASPTDNEPPGVAAPQPPNRREAARRGRRGRTGPTREAAPQETATAAAPPDNLSAPAPAAPAPLRAGMPAHTQLQLLTAMRAVGTAAAMRCVGDALFSQRLLSAEEGPYDPCPCGSAETFGRCCQRAQEELRAVLPGESADAAAL